MAAPTASEYHEITESVNLSDVRHSQPLDWRFQHVWFCEPPTAHGVLTEDGMTQIAVHKYKGGTYTYLDHKMNPIWLWLTNCLPMSMAPNVVSALGGLHCVAAFMVTWMHTPSFTDNVPNWLLFFNAYCMIVYYTLDCMDGKQARRTGNSSPLGQLFDHGVDCVCLMAHLSCAHAWSMSGETYWFFGTQAALQFSFFVAQLEEYYTGVLPHANGELGVTEVNYGFAAISALNAFVDRPALYSKPLLDIFALMGVDPYRLSAILPWFDKTVQVRHVLLIGWPAMMIILILLSIGRIVASIDTMGKRLSALSKIVSPLALSLCPLFLPLDIIQAETRFVFLSVGLALCLVTIKMIVFSMARQAYAAIQWDALWCLLAVFWVQSDTRLTEEGIHLVWQVLTLWYLARIVWWTSLASTQLCQRLGIRMFSIKQKSKE